MLDATVRWHGEISYFEGRILKGDLTSLPLLTNFNESFLVDGFYSWLNCRGWTINFVC